MFEIGWTEMLVIAIVMIVVVGPKDLPRMLRTFGKTVTKLRGMAGDFQKQFNDALKEAELDDVKKSIDDIRSLNPMADIRKQLNPFEKAAADVRAGLDQALKPTPSTSSEPAIPTVHPAEPLKTGAADIPGVVPEAIVAPPTELASATPVPVQGPVMGETVAVKAKPARTPAKPKAAPTNTRSKIEGPVAKPAAGKAASRKAQATVETSPVAAVVKPIKTVAAKPAVAKPAPKKAVSDISLKPVSPPKGKGVSANGAARSGTPK